MAAATVAARLACAGITTAGSRPLSDNPAALDVPAPAPGPVRRLGQGQRSGQPGRAAAGVVPGTIPAFPKIRDVVYSPGASRFERLSDETEFTSADFRDLAQGSSRSPHPGGRATLARAALAHTVLRQDGAAPGRRHLLSAPVELVDQGPAPAAEAKGTLTPTPVPSLGATYPASAPSRPATVPPVGRP